MAEPIDIGLVGTGDWGANLLRNFAALPGVRLAAVCDADPRRLAQAAGRYPEARAFAHVDQLAQAPNLRAVVVAASAVAHYPVARALLEAGKDVFVEKPLALEVAHAEELVSLARRGSLVLMTGHLLIHHPGVRYIKGMVERGELGDVYYLYSQRVNLGKVRRDENALWSFAPHDLSVILHLLEAEPLDVVARGSAFVQGTVEDVVFVDLKFPGGKLAHLHVSWLDPHKLRKITVVGSQKMVVFDDMEASEKVRIYDKGVDRAGHVVSYGDSLTVRSGDILIPKISLQEPLRLECQHFIDCVRERTTPLTDGAGGLRVVRVLAAAQASLDKGGAPVPLAREGAAVS